ncbi:phage gp6-like head-tail connector protein [Fructobacillus sp. CRL 2054]|uniref:head-tail connector protein n=1 Tax=Fructobacillus sp. CRL 2054 TaxID=2763007 RepID=UPI002378C717|nr:head-tail connector protein [Fructobacillus sp. CRL 2054]MDD9139142.1 phage gp6-like head-tail connector protein [Fructobacillus sp. CRL 2054]
MIEPLVSIDDLKLSLRVDTNADDTLLHGYAIAAENYIKNAVGNDKPAFYQQDNVVELIRVAVIAQASAYYSYRTALSLVQSYPIELAVDSIVSQLQGEYARFEEENTDANKST